jgi:hypothetical protein
VPGGHITPRGPALDRERMLALERVELLAKLDGLEGAPKAARELGLVLQHVGGAWAFGRVRDTTLSFNRVMGLGLERPGPLDEASAKSVIRTPIPGHLGCGDFNLALTIFAM